jgi:Uma2 family endonuclease
MSPASERHQDLAGLLAVILRVYLEDHDAGRVLSAPFQMKLPPSIRRGREPDLVFVAKDNLGRLRQNFLDGPADWVIEIVSPESVERDAKYREYEAGGVREYWIMDPNLQQAGFFVLDSVGRYQRMEPEADGKHHSAILPGFWISVGWLWQTPLPPVRQILREWEA